jgi:hypothetical protein
MNLVQILQTAGTLALYKPMSDEAHILANEKKRYVCAGNNLSIILVDIDDNYQVIHITELRPGDASYSSWLSMKFSPADNLHLRL